MSEDTHERADIENATSETAYDAQSDLALPHTANESQTADDGLGAGMGSVLPTPAGNTAYDVERDIGS